MFFILSRDKIKVNIILEEIVMRKIKIAQIGTSANSHGNMIFNSLKKQKDIFEIVGYAMPENEEEKFPEHMKLFEGYQKMTVEEILNCSEIEAVVIETEEIYLTKYAILVAQSGKHIHMEKPGSIRLRDFETLIDMLKEKQTIFHTGYMYRYNPVVRELLEKVRSGELGDIISVEAQMNCIHPAETRQWLAHFPGGMMFFLGCHLIDLILQIQGMPERIIPLNKATGVGGVTAKDYGMAIFEYQNGVSFAKTSALEIGGYARRQLVVTGTKGTIELKPFEMYGENPEYLYTKKTEYDSTSWGDMGTTSISDSYDRYDDMMASFASMVRGEKANPYTYDYELELYRTILRACGGENDVSE